MPTVNLWDCLDYIVDPYDPRQLGVVGSANATPKSTRREANTVNRSSARLHATSTNDQTNFDTENESEQPTKPVL